MAWDERALRLEILGDFADHARRASGEIESVLADRAARRRERERALGRERSRRWRARRRRMRPEERRRLRLKRERSRMRRLRYFDRNGLDRRQLFFPGMEVH